MKKHMYFLKSFIPLHSAVFDKEDESGVGLGDIEEGELDVGAGSDGEEGKEKSKEEKEAEEAEKAKKEAEEAEKAKKAEEESKKKEKETGEKKTEDESKKEEVKTGEDKKEEEKKIETDDDIFDLSEFDKPGTKTDTKVSYKNLGKRLELNLEDNDDNEEAFISAVQNKIENATQKTELDLSKYNDAQKNLIKVLEKTGSEKAFIDPVAGLNDWFALSDEKKLRAFYKFQHKLSDQQIEDKLDDLKEKNQFESEVEQVIKIISGEKEKILQDVTKNIEQRAARAHQQDVLFKKNMTSEITKMETFMGKKIKPEVKDFILSEIDTGRLVNKISSNPRAMVFARLFDMFGGRILKQFEDTIKEAKRQGYNVGKQSEKEKYHKEKPQGGGGGKRAEDKEKKETGKGVRPITKEDLNDEIDAFEGF